MKHVSINIAEKLKKLLPETIEKDLTDNEIICPTCGGLGVIKKDYYFCVKNEMSPSLKYDWYDNEYLTLCPNCYFGRLRKCEYCGEALNKFNSCDCDKSKEAKAKLQFEKYQEKILRAKEVKPEDVTTYLYDADNNKYYADTEEFVEDFYDSYAEDNGFCDSFEQCADMCAPKILWVTESTTMSMDAASIIESACDELHEDAMDNISYKDRDELQKYLDEWCAKQYGTETFYPCYKEYVKVKKEWFGD